MLNDKQFNQLMIKLSSIEKLMKIMIKIDDPDHDHDPFKSSALDHDHDHDQSQESDDDVIAWYRTFLLDNGFDPENRDYEKVLRSIKYFKKMFSTLTNPYKYQLSFMPKQIAKTTPRPDEDNSLIMGLPREAVESMSAKLTLEIIKQLRSSVTVCGSAPKPDKKILDNPMWRNVFTAYALKEKLL